MWDNICPPAKRPFGSDLAPVCTDGGEDVETASSSGLLVRLPPDVGEDPAEPPQSTVTAAPTAMWREVPRSLLPSWNAQARAVRLPYGPGPWRVQACTENRCSRWTDVPNGAGQVALPLPQARTVSRMITADGSPLPGARFHLVRPGRDVLSLAEILGFEQADEEGRIAFRLPADEDAAVVVSIQGREAAAFAMLRDVPHRVELEPGLFVSGRIVDEAGDPVASRLRGRSFIRDGFGLTQLQTGRTRIDGRFRLSGFSAGDATLRAVAEADGELELARRLELEESVDMGDLVLSKVEIVWVRVIDALSRAPVDGALIRAADGQETRTGPDGLARLPVRYGRELQVIAGGYGFNLLRLPAGVGRVPDEPFPIELDPALTVTGVYVAADGLTPAEGGRLSARSAADLLLSKAIQDDGAFSIDLPTPGSWELELTAGNAGSTRVEITGVGGETIDLGTIRARPSALVSGHLVSEGHEPLTGASVTSTPPSTLGPLVAPLAGGALTAESDRDGYFELHGLEPGPATLRFAAQKYAPLRLEIHVEDAERIDVGTVELSRGRKITVRSDVERGSVVLTAGHAVPPEKKTAALRDGEAVFGAVPAEPLEIVVLNGGGQPICTRRVSGSEGDLTLRCNDRSVRVTGRVTTDGSPARGSLRWRHRSGDAELPGGLFRSRVDGLERVEAVTNRLQDLQSPLDEGGMYRLASVLPGEWEVHWMPAAGGAQEPHVVNVPAGAGREVVRDIAYQGASVQGVVLDPEGLPAGRATVEAFPGQPPVLSDSHGSFRMLGMRPGRYQLRARQRHLRSELVEVELDRPGDRETVQLHLVDEPTSDRLRIELQGSAGGFCFVETNNGSGGQLVQVRGGRSEVPLEPPLGELVRAACIAEGRWVLGGWRDLRQALDDGLAFDPDASTASLALIGQSRVGGVTISAPGGWNLGPLRMWFGGATTFSVGETIPNLPVGAYTIRSGDVSRTVVTEHRRITEVEIDD